MTDNLQGMQTQPLVTEEPKVQCKNASMRLLQLQQYLFGK